MKKSKNDWLFEVLIGAVCSVISAAYLIACFFIKGSTQLSGVNMNSISPDLFPKAVGIISIITSLCILLPALIKWKKAPKDSDIPDTKRPPILTKGRIFILICMAVFMVVLPYIGYLLASFLLASVILNYVERPKWKRNLIFSAAFSVLSFLLFNNVLSIYLPVGKIFELIFNL